MNSNKPYVSRYLRKQNYQSINYPSPQPFSPHHTQTYSTQHQHSAQKRLNQQRHIQQLQQKVDLILKHNQALVAENAQLIQKLTQNKSVGLASIERQRMSRYQIEDSQYAIRKIRSELQIKIRECEMLACENESIKQANKKQAQGLKLIINSITLSYEQVKIENIKLIQQMNKLKQDQQGEKRLVIKEVQRKYQDELLRIQRQRIQQLNRQKEYNGRVVIQLTNKFDEQRIDWNNRKNILVNRLQQNHNRQINELRQQMGNQFNHQLSKLQQQATQRCKNQREKAQNFIRQSLAGFNNGNEVQLDQLRQQIKNLQISLDNRGRLLRQITNMQLNRNNEIDSNDELLLLRRRLQQQIQNLLRDNELLKIKMAQKYQFDFRQMVKIYNNKIQILSTQIKYLNDQNNRLRLQYQTQIQNKIKLKRNWQIEVGSLKNLIRKLKVQLHGIQQQYKLNIQGIRDQNTTFSMTLMKSMIQDRDKANFFQDQNRKLRALYDKHEIQVQTQKNQALQRIKFYENKYEQLRKMIDDDKRYIRQKQQLIDIKLQQKQRKVKQNILRQKQLLQKMINEFEIQKQNFEKQILQNRQKLQNQQLEIKQAHQDIEILKSKIKQNQQHIQRLRMQLEMAGVDDTQKQDAINHWKQHYQGIILKLQGDKKELKTIIQGQNNKIQQLVYKYKLLENQLAKANITLNKRGEIDKRVIQLGLDQGLVKAMSQLWKKNN